VMTMLKKGDVVQPIAQAWMGIPEHTQHIGLIVGEKTIMLSEIDASIDTRWDVPMRLIRILCNGKLSSWQHDVGSMWEPYGNENFDQS
jgi:hypothetical protein